MIIYYFAILILLLDIYSEYQINNKENFSERILFLFGARSFSNIIYLGFFIAIGFLAIKKIIPNYYNSQLEEFTIKSLDSLRILVVPLVYIIISIIFNSSRIIQRFNQQRLYKIDLPQKINLFLKFTLYRLISFIVFFVIILYIFKAFVLLNLSFVNQGLYLLDWLDFANKDLDNYNKGIYISILLSVGLILWLNMSFVKISSHYTDRKRIHLQAFVQYLFLCVIIFIASFFGLFSIFNAIYNAFNYASIQDWLSNENLLGVFPLRISAIILSIYLMKYLFKNVFHNNLFTILSFGFIFKDFDDKWSSRINRVSISERSALFFSQISFYILSLALSEYLMIIDYDSTWLSILNFSILFILDDFGLINDYSRGLTETLKSHLIRLYIFNFLLFLTAVVILAGIKQYWILVTYLTIFTILFVIYFSNRKYINTRYY